MGDRLQHLRDGVRALSTDVALDRASAIYETRPVGLIDQPDFLNAVVTGMTRMQPADLLDRLHVIEHEAGRVRSTVGGPRTLDIDILFFGDRIIQTPTLTVPHPSWTDRAFVRVPLEDVASEQRDPVTGRLVVHTCQAAVRSGVRRVAPPSLLEKEF